uniref:hypothetical protein n=1 Tax=Prevotella sp. TaxID=59823 RepID=UPI004025B7B1
MNYFGKWLIIKRLRFQWLFGVANSLKWHRRYGAIASPLRCYRVAVTVQLRRDCTVTAKLFGRKAIGGAAKGHLEADFPL